MPSTERLVTLKRLDTLLDAYGADPARWPEQERAAALALIDTSADARSTVERARTLDAVLDRVEEPVVSPALARRVQRMHRPARANPLTALFAVLRDRLRPGPNFAWQGAVAAAAVIGMAAGIALSELALDKPQPAPVVTAAAPPAAEPVVVEPSIILVDGTTGEEALTMTASLAPDISQISLTGQDGADAAQIMQPDDSEIATASIPLY